LWWARDAAVAELGLPPNHLLLQVLLVLLVLLPNKVAMITHTKTTSNQPTNQ
jgi:hypothetical protein